MPSMPGVVDRALGADERPRVAVRLAGLAALLIVELLVISTWLDGQALIDSGGLTGAIARSGATLLRFAVASAVMFLVFSSAPAMASIGSLPVAAQDRGTRWRLLLAHAGLLLLFVPLSALLFTRQLAAHEDGLGAVWLLTGAAALATAALAWLPAAFWTSLIRRTRGVLLFAVAVAAGACAFGWLAWTLWRPLSHSTLAIAHVLLGPMLPGVHADAASLIIGGPTFNVWVAPECSGYEGLGLMLAFTSAWLWLHRRDWRFPRALLLVPVGLAAVWLANCLRIAGLVYIGNVVSPEIALGGFHSQAGWLAFNGVALGVCVAARRVPWLARGPAAPARATTNPTAAYLVPFLTVLAAAMGARLVSGDFDWLYPVRVLGAIAALAFFGRHYRTLDWRISTRAIGLGVVAFVLWLLFDVVLAGPIVPMPEPLTAAPGGLQAIWLAFRIFGTVVTVPIVEELAFRGFLLRRFVSDDFERVGPAAITRTAIVLSSLAFGMLHGEQWLAATLAGSIYAVAYLRRGAIGDAVAAHATTNLLVAIAALATDQWQLW